MASRNDHGPKLANYYSENTGDGRMYKSPRSMETYPSATTVLKLVHKDLKQWAANSVAKWATENWMYLGNKSDEKAYNQARFRWKDELNLRADVGTNVHAYVEAEHLGQFEFPALNEEEVQIIDQWHDLNQWYSIEPVLSEFQCFREWVGYGHAGTADGMWMIDGKLTLVDIKTSKNTYDEHWMQVAGLGACEGYYEDLHPEIPSDGYKLTEKNRSDWVWREMPEFEQYALVHLRADHAEILIKSRNDPEMGLHRQQFLGYAGLWHINNELKRVRKERENGR